MSISSAMYTAVTGISTMGTAMSVISNNIANLNTVGFKQSRPQFIDLLSQRVFSLSATAQVGQGVALGSVSAVFSQGAFENSEENTSLAISGEGMFLVRDPDSDAVYYTRAGNFTLDSEGRLVNPLGYLVQGWALTEEGLRSGEPTDIVLTTTNLEPSATSQLTSILNLDSSSSSQSPSLWAAWDGTEDVPISGTSYSYQTSVRVYDSLGESHELTIYFDPNYTPPTATLTPNYAGLATSLAGANNDLQFVAADPGVAGANITITYVDPAANNQALSVSVVGNDITVSLATDGAGAITSTAADILAAIQADADASDLVDVSLAGTDTGAGVVTAMAQTNLSTGVDNDLIFTAATGGTNGNLIEIEYVDPHAANQTLSLTPITGNVIQINLATDATGAVTTTAADILALIEADATASSLVEVELPAGGAGAGVVVPMKETYLSGGSDVNSTPNQWEYIICCDPETDFRTIDATSIVDSQYAGLLMRGTLTFDPATGLIDTSDPDALTAEVLTDITSTPPGWSNDSALTALTPSNSGYFSLTANFINGGADQEIEINFGLKNPLGLGNWTPETLTISQFASASTASYQNQNGYATGLLEGLSVDTDGTVYGTYSNGRTLGTYQVALGLFQNPWGLNKLGQNLYGETIGSGTPTVVPPGTGGVGEVHANSLEQSNVDLAKEFVDMIIIQRGYQANSKSITTADTLLAELLQLKR